MLIKTGSSKVNETIFHSMNWSCWYYFLKFYMSDVHLTNKGAEEDWEYAFYIGE